MCSRRNQTLTNNHTVESVHNLLANIASRGKLRPTFAVMGTDSEGNAIGDRNGRDVSLDAVNLARRMRSQQGLQNVTVYRYSENTHSYVEDGAVQEVAFPTKNADAPKDEGDLQTKRSAKDALDSHKALTHKVRVAAPLDADSRQALLESFIETYIAMGGSHQELFDAIEEAVTEEVGG